MSEDLLRRAAKVLREHADAAAQGTWTAADLGYPQGVWSAERPFDQDPDGWFISTTLAEKPNEDASYIALMHPPVALALAAVLDNLAEAIHGTVGDRAADDIFESEMALARAILREDVHA